MSMMVKQVIDPKWPLKGKGVQLAQWARAADDRLSAIYAAMDELVQRTRTIEGRRFSLMVNKLRDARQLRWRFMAVTEGSAGRHATWDKIELLLPEFSAVLAQWYGEANELALVLNHQEQVARYECKTVQRLLQGRARIKTQVYTGEVGRGAGGGRQRGFLAQQSK